MAITTNADMAFNEIDNPTTAKETVKHPAISLNTDASVKWTDGQGNVTFGQPAMPMTVGDRFMEAHRNGESEQFLATLQKLSAPKIGDDVLYVLDSGPHKGEVRPAKVVQVWNQVAGGLVNLQVFTDGGNDGVIYASGIFWATSVHYSEDGEPRSWHWRT